MTKKRSTAKRSTAKKTSGRTARTAGAAKKRATAKRSPAPAARKPAAKKRATAKRASTPALGEPAAKRSSAKNGPVTGAGSESELEKSKKPENPEKSMKPEKSKKEKKKEKKEKKRAGTNGAAERRISNKRYEKTLARQQIELVKLQEWVKHTGRRVVIIFEGRDAAGKGGTIKRITEPLNPRICNVVALPAPTEREQTQWYFQRYARHLPAAGEIVILDRSWYNRAGVERVMGFCTEEEYQEFMRSCPEFERMLVRSGIQLIKYWFSVSDEEQERRFQQRLEDPTKRWKLSPMDLESRNRWADYSKAKDEMFEHTDIEQAPWYVVESDVKKHARLNCIAHLLTRIPYEDLTPKPIKLEERPPQKNYDRPPIEQQNFVPDVVHDEIMSS